MSTREELKQLLKQDPRVIETLKHEISAERDEAARKTKAQAEKERRERELIARQAALDAECDRPVLELVGKCQNCKSTINISPEINFCYSPYNIRAKTKCSRCGKTNWIFLACGGPGGPDVPLKIDACLNPKQRTPYFESGKLVVPAGARP